MLARYSAFFLAFVAAAADLAKPVAHEPLRLLRCAAGE